MTPRNRWQQHIAIAGSAEGRTASQFPATIAALELWARDSLLRGYRYRSPWVVVMDYGTRVDKEFVAIIESTSDRVDAAVLQLPPSHQAVIRAHYLHEARHGERTVRIPHKVGVPERARRYLNMTKDNYYAYLADAHGWIAARLDLDGA